MMWIKIAHKNFFNLFLSFCFHSHKAGDRRDYIIASVALKLNRSNGSALAILRKSQKAETWTGRMKNHPL